MSQTSVELWCSERSSITAIPLGEQSHNTTEFVQLLSVLPCHRGLCTLPRICRWRATIVHRCTGWLARKMCRTNGVPEHSLQWPNGAMGVVGQEATIYTILT